MPPALEKLGEPGPYRVASLTLVAVTLLVPIGALRLGLPEWVGALFGLAAYILLIVLTYHRLRDAELSGGWIMLMIIVFNFGPRWQGPEPLELYASHLIYLVPIAMGWVAQGRPRKRAVAAISNSR